MNTELYINNQLCDIDSPEKLGITLKRVLINPSELNVKDVQKSYDINLPATVRNNEIFNYANVEETQGKFRIYGDARLYVDGVLILDGKFRLSEITRDYYRGNLGVPAPLTVKDVFGETKMTENAPLWINFKDFAASVNGVNERAKKGEVAECIFPYVLYGLLPKNLTSVGETSTDRDLWDESVNIRIQDMPPSINVINMLKHIFENREFSLSGTALSDPRLTKLYMSYKNDESYVQPWNYGDQMAIKIKGKWMNVDWDRELFERNCHITNVDNLTYYTGDLFDSYRADIDIIEDKGANVLTTEHNEGKDYIRRGHQVTIPMSGLYKVRLKADLCINNLKNRNAHDSKANILFLSGDSEDDPNTNSLRKNRYEIKLLRDWNSDDFGFSDIRVNKRYYVNNLNQVDLGEQNDYNRNVEQWPLYFPATNLTESTDNENRRKESEILFVDPSENNNCVVGLAWGHAWHTEGGTNDQGNSNLLISNPKQTDYGTVLVAKTGFSWNNSFNSSNISKVAINNPIGYKRRGPIASLANDQDAPNLDLPSENLRYDVYIDTNGILQKNTDSKEKTIVLSRLELAADSTYILSIPVRSGWSGLVRLYNTNNEELGDHNKIEPEDNDGYREYIIDTRGGYRYLSLMVMHDLPETPDSSFDIRKETRFRKLNDDKYLVGWSDTDMFKMEVKNSPDSYARRGPYKGHYVNNDWFGDGEVNAIVWFNAGEKVTLAVSSDVGTYVGRNRLWGWANQELDFELDITPFRTDEKWVKVDTSGNGIKNENMDWNDEPTFPTDKIDLVKFLPNDVRTDEFIENFCKAFNIKLIQIAKNKFSLDLKQTKKAQHYEVVDLDQSATVLKVANESLGLPLGYSLGFTINENEEGYVKSKDDGGGTYATGASEGSFVEQKSNFSYNWFKPIRKIETGKPIPIQLPVISDTEPWTDTVPYVEAMGKRYWNLAQRFWYFDGLLNDLDVSFHYGKDKQKLKLAKVSDTLPGMNTLSYKNEKNTILDNYFSLVTDANSNYTIVESHLTPLEYSKIGDGARVRFNGDLYYVAEVDGYSPLGRKPAKLKLIRKLL